MLFPMPQRNWNRDELLLAMNLYCRTPFGRMDKRNPEIIALATALGRTPSSVGMKLCNLASLDPNERARGIAGLTKTSAADRAIWEEFHADWESAAYESETLYRDRVPASVPASAPRVPGSDAGHVELTPRRSPDNLPTDDAIALRADQETETTRSVRIRTAQDFFRRAVLASYGTTCCISGIALPELLIASHILPWSSISLSSVLRGEGWGEGRRRVDPRNGLCLSRLHDAAFDRGLITFDADLRLVLSRDLREHVTNSVLYASFANYEGHPLTLPEKFLPERTSLERHREVVFRG